MKIMTFNILEGGVDDNGSRVEHIIDTIKEVNPDFLAIQEADNFNKNNNELLKRVSKETNLPYYTLSRCALDEKQKHYHVASLSRYPLREEHSLLGSAFRGAALSVVIDSPLGELSLCNVHLHVQSEDERLKELEVVLNHQSKYEKNIVLGDHNALSRTDDYEDLSGEEFTHYNLNRFDVTDILNKSYVDTITKLDVKEKSTHPTIGVGHPISKILIRIDYIFVTPSLSSNIKSGEVIKTKSSEVASDHYPVVVTLN